MSDNKPGARIFTVGGHVPEPSAHLHWLIRTLHYSTAEQAASKCAEAKDLTTQNPSWLREPAIYNNLNTEFRLHRNDPHIRDLFETYCRSADTDILAITLNGAIRGAKAYVRSEVPSAYEDQVDMFETVVKQRPDVILLVAFNLNTARSESRDNPFLNRLVAAVSGVEAQLREEKGPKDANRFSQLARRIGKLVSGQTAG